MVRIGIREQLGVVTLLFALVPLCILSVAVWINNHNFVVSITSSELALTASLKAAQVAADLLIIQATCSTIVTRVLLQNMLRSFNKNPTPGAVNMTNAYVDIQSALVGGGFSALLQAVVFSKDDNTNNTDGSILRATIANVTIRTGTYPNGTEAYLGDNSDLGFPEALYPNITYNSTTTNTAFSDFPLNSTSTLLLGPVSINESYALVSITLPILDNNSNNGTLLGFMTVVAAATSIISVTQSREGLGNTGVVLLVGPSRRENLFRYEQRPATADYTAGSAMDLANVHFVLPPPSDNSTRSRHSQYLSNLTAFQSSNFTLKKYPAALNGFSQRHPGVNNQSSQMSTTNENNVSVAVGYARPQSSLVSWLLIVEQSHAEAWAPIYKLRKIVLACVFGTIGAIIVVIVPLAHFSVRPIRRLRDATKKSISPPGFSPREGSFDSDRDISGDEGEDIGAPNSTKSKKGFFVRLRNLTGTQKKTARQRTEEERRRTFKIPAKVKNRKHWITDELTELTGTFNDMTDELMLQYSSLEERVAQRTEELEIAKQAAETANEAKTLFIANISHELKTPLNGILGMCSICMSETDLDKIKRSLQIVYKSGDLLLHLLNDLLLFSKNQIGQQVSLEEREFRLIDIKTQVQTIFHKQVIDGKIDFSVKFIGSEPEFEHIEDSGSKLPALGPQGTGRLKDMSLWGDQHRILQIIINLVSNSLKFTPEGGKVEVRIQCTGEVETSAETSRNSMGSKQSSQRTTRGRHRHESGSSGSQISRKHSGNKTQGTALLINPMDKKATTRVVREREPTPPPPGARTLNFQFEVQDTGPGIPVSMRDRVFEPFVQGDLGLSKKFGGTGLGLSICSQLAKLMGGDIILDSAEGVGSTFTMNIPLKHTKSRASSTSSSAQGSRPTSEHTTSDARLSSPKRNVDTSMEKDSQPRLVGLSAPFFASAPLPSPEHDVKQLAALDTVEAARKAGSKLRVLVAEDNLVNQEVVLRMLKLEDVYDVVIAKDGQEAYDKVKESMSEKQFFDLIFMDIQMPNLDGLQSTRMIREMGYSAPIVALTAFSEESNIRDCYDSGMNHFLSKPIRRPALKQVLKQFATIVEESETQSIARSSPPHSEKGSVNQALHPITNGSANPPLPA